jgi:cellulose synthase/poly-beta-1,6-N-acetylglucosamine synthase-like glycosyltransferase
MTPTRAVYPSLDEEDWENASIPQDHPEQTEAGKTVQGEALAAQPEVPITVYAAEPFNAPEQESPMYKGGDAPNMPDESAPFVYFQRQTEVHWYGWFAMTFYLAAFVFYLWVRISKTMNMGPGYVWYGIYLLVVEILGASTVILYGTNLLWNPVIEKFPEDPDTPGKPKVRLPYHVRVCVPCYKEDLEIVRRTIMAAYDADLPRGCSRTIYLCDDGKDPAKRKWCEKMGPSVVYVSGRKRPAGEMNGKSGNLNNCLNQLYPKEYRIPGNEIICVFDADQVAKKDFFLKTLPYFDAGDDVGMVLSPQCFHNLNLHEDIFNHSNIHFWEYMQPGYDALGFISCTGTNFLVRAQAIQEVGGSPTYTMTEDYALGMEMKKFGWHCRYVQEYLAIGEAPHEVRNMYQQRSRWTKGHFQIMFNPKVSPLFQTKLSPYMRMMYCSGVWSYMVAAISTPTFIIIPLVTIWIGVFPLNIDGRSPHWIALAMTIYSAATMCVQYYVRHPNHMEALWFANVANQLLWWTYIKACWRALTAKLCFSTITFKATAKGPGKLKDSALRDLWLPGLSFGLLFISGAIAVWQLIAGVDFFSPLTISLLWAIYNAIPPFLILWYSVVGRGFLLQFACKFCMIASFSCGIAAIGLVWAIKTYDVKQFGGGLAQSEDMGVLFRYIHDLPKAVSG